MESTTSVQLKNRVGEIIQLISVSNADVTIIDETPKNQPEGNNNNNVNKSIQLALLGKQLIDDIIHEVSLAEAAKINASSFSSASTAVPRNNNNANHGGDGDASARFV